MTSDGLVTAADLFKPVNKMPFNWKWTVDDLLVLFQHGWKVHTENGDVFMVKQDG